jgi:ABC-type nitrate/sulfonate/bicarbonate transport system substrate-binding protein
VEFTNANPQESAALAAKYFRKTPEEVLEGVKSFKYFGAANWRDHMKLHAGQMQFLAQWMFDNGKIPALPDSSKWENTKFIP